METVDRWYEEVARYDFNNPDKRKFKTFYSLSALLCHAVTEVGHDVMKRVMSFCVVWNFFVSTYHQVLCQPDDFHGWVLGGGFYFILRSKNVFLTTHANLQSTCANQTLALKYSSRDEADMCWMWCKLDHRGSLATKRTISITWRPPHITNI